MYQLMYIFRVKNFSLVQAQQQSLLVNGLVLTIASAGALVCTAAFAQRAPIDAGTLQRNLENQLPLPAPLDLKEPLVRDAEIRTQKSNEVVATVLRFELTGVTKVDVEELQEVLKPYLEKPITFDDLQQACDAIEAVYRKKGFLAQAVVQPQTITGGVLVITITESRLGAVIIDAPEDQKNFSSERAIGFITWVNPEGQELNLHKITRAVTLLNEVPGITASSALEASAKDGETNLRITLKNGDSYSASVDGNNFGSRSTGVVQTVVQGTVNSPLGIGDQVTAHGIYSEGSSYTQAAYFLPILPNGLRGGITGSALSYRSIGPYQLNGSYGEAYTISTTLAAPLIRTDAVNANLALRYDHKSYLNYLIANDAVTSSYVFNNLNLSLSGIFYDTVAGEGLTNAQVSLMLGKLELQGNNPSNYGVYTPGQFVKLSFNASRSQNFLSENDKLIFALSGQLANENLNSAEQFYLGGPYGVRAYPVAQAGGSQGVQLTLEYQHSLPNNLQGIVFFDSGLIQQYVRPYDNWKGNTNADNLYSLYGAGVGVKWVTGNLSLAATLARSLGENPLYNQQGQSVNVDGMNSDWRGWITASYKF